MTGGYYSFLAGFLLKTFQEGFFCCFIFVGHSIWHQVVTLLKESHRWLGICGLSWLNIQFFLRQSLGQELLSLFLHSFPHFHCQFLSEAWHRASCIVSLKQYHHVSVLHFLRFKQIPKYYVRGEFLLMNLPASDRGFGVSLHDPLDTILPSGL